MQIRPFETHDKIAVNELLTQLKRGEIINIDENALNTGQNSHYVVIEQENTVVGFGCLISYYLPTVGKTGEIHDVIIGEKYRGQGFGRKLIEHLIELAKENNISRLQLTSRPAKASARNLYQSIGFMIKDTNVFIMDIAGKK